MSVGGMQQPAGPGARILEHEPRSTRFYLAAIGGFVILSAVYLGGAALPAPVTTQIVFSDLAFLLTIASVVATGYIAYRRSAGAEARFWLLLAAANAVMLVSELYWVWWIVSEGHPPPPIHTPFQILHVAAALLLLVMLTSMTRYQGATAVQKTRYVIDGVAMIVLAWIAFLRFGVVPLFSQVPDALPIDFIAGAAYPVWGIVVAGGSLAALLGFRVSRWKPWEKFVTSSLVIYGAGIAMWPLWYVTFKSGDSSYERGVLDLVLLGGQYLLLVATTYRLTRADQEWPLRPMPLFQPARGGRWTYVIPTMTLAALPLMVVLALSSDAGSLYRGAYTTVAVILAILTVARTTIVAIENGRLFHHSVTDPLTGLFNHRFFHDRLAVELDIAKRYGESLSLVVMDVDDFDTINNLHGHPVGDTMLADVAAAIRSAGRDSDVVCRVGGDEFAAILPETGPVDATRVAMRIQERVRAIRVPDERPITMSIGIATFPDHADTAEELVRLADGASYWVKRHGKDHALIYDADIVTELTAGEHIRALEERTHLGTVRALAAAVDARDPATQFHSRNVASLAVQVARELGLDGDRCRLIESAALMHDIGKIGVADDVLSKAASLSDAEMRHVREHPELGERILSSTMLDEVLPWIRHHHERWDGSGYPDGLRAVAIPLESRILAVCDAWDAMVSERPYRPAMSRREAVGELVSHMGTQFDPAVVEVFLRTLGHEPDGSAPERR